jgi:hypothetical protein
MNFSFNFVRNLESIKANIKQVMATNRTARLVMKSDEALKQANRLAVSIETAVKNALVNNSEPVSGFGSLAFAHSENNYVVEGFTWLEKLNGLIEVATYTVEGTKTATANIPTLSDGDVRKAITARFKANLFSRGFSAFNFRFFANN